MTLAALCLLVGAAAAPAPPPAAPALPSLEARARLLALADARAFDAAALVALASDADAGVRADCARA
ncbi:MAG TPA: hypothetical protein VLW17_15630, partial [Thermoanaerobaculaceae bacterium]|nr:hypothetical protein [Thermoanaerobaculaceae bacterium]